MKNPFKLDDLELREADSVVRGLAGGVKITYDTAAEIGVRQFPWFSRMSEIDKAAQSVADKEAVLLRCKGYTNTVTAADDCCKSGFVYYHQFSKGRPGFDNRRLNNGIIVCPTCGYTQVTPHV